jgi:hypothetical protein
MLLTVLLTAVLVLAVRNCDLTAVCQAFVSIIYTATATAAAVAHTHHS